MYFTILIGIFANKKTFQVFETWKVENYKKACPTLWFLSLFFAAIQWIDACWLSARQYNVIIRFVAVSRFKIISRNYQRSTFKSSQGAGFIVYFGLVSINIRTRAHQVVFLHRVLNFVFSHQSIVQQQKTSIGLPCNRLNKHCAVFQ